MPYATRNAAFDPASVSADTLAVNARLADTLANLQRPGDIAEARIAYAEGRLGLPASPRSPEAKTRSIPGPQGPIDLRVLAPVKAQGVYLHIHGGAWSVGNNDTWDAPLIRIAEEAGVVCISVNYRLAPEHPFPAAIDDCVAAARWLIANARSVFGATWLAIGGESAGAHLTAATLVQLRDAGEVEAFKAVNFMFGCFDLSLTPSARASEGTAFVDHSFLVGATAAFLGDVDPRSPEASPLYADLSGLPPALFSVGTLDPLIDDTLFMHERWQAAGNASRLALYPGGVHGFNSLDGELAASSHADIGGFLREARTGVPGYASATP